MKLLTKLPKREPVLIAAFLVATLNLVIGHDSGLSTDVITTVVTLVLGVAVRSKVTPVHEYPEAGAGD